MAPARRREGVNLTALLLGQPYRFDFFQAVRLLGWITRDWAKRQPQPCRFVGQDSAPEEEAVRFRHVPELRFPPSPVEIVRPSESAAPLEVLVSFLGLVGSGGVMPHHYTSLLMRQMRDGDRSLLAFLDVFQHRIVSHFYRAWEKYRLPVAFERFRLEHGKRQDDPVTWGLYCLTGLGTQGLRNRLTVPDSVFLYYAGHFAHQPRNAVSLEALLRDYFDLPVALNEMQGHWLALDEEDVSRMSGQKGGGRNNALGVSMVVGRRIWDVQSKFRLRIGPLGYATFSRLMPNGDVLRPLCQLTRTYAGPELDFDVQPVLKANEVPPCRLNSGEKSSRLGWNTWVHSRPMTRDVDDAVFQLNEL